MGGLASKRGSMLQQRPPSAEDTLNRISWSLLAVFLGLAVAAHAGWVALSPESIAAVCLRARGAMLSRLGGRAARAAQRRMTPI